MLLDRVLHHVSMASPALWYPRVRSGSDDMMIFSSISISTTITDYTSTIITLSCSRLFAGHNRVLILQQQTTAMKLLSASVV